MREYIKQLIEHYQKAIDAYKESNDFDVLKFYHVQWGVCNCADHLFFMDFQEQEAFWKEVIGPHVPEVFNGGFWTGTPTLDVGFYENLDRLRFRLNKLKEIYERTDN